MTPEALSILKNQEIIAINQDPAVGTSVTPFRWGINVGTACFLLTISLTFHLSTQPDWTYNSTHPAQYWSGRSQNGTVFMLVRSTFWSSTDTQS